MHEVVWLDEAVDQLDLIIAYIRTFDPVAARRMSTRLVELEASLTEFPNRGRPLTNGARELVTVPPYILRYEVVGGTVFIVGVRHGARYTD